LHEAGAGTWEGLLEQLKSIIIVEHLDGVCKCKQLLGAKLANFSPLLLFGGAVLLEVCQELLVIKESVFGIDLTENFKSKKEKSILDDEKTAGEEEEDSLAWRYPEYPEGMHDAGKADRRGPFWSSLGEPDVSTGPRPNYLRRDDWHISSTYTNEQREAIAKEEAEVKAIMEEKRREGELAAAALEGTIEEMDDETFFAPKEYMRLEPGPPHTGPLPSPSKYPMPNTWQAYQALQEKVFLLGEDNEALREEAAVHEAALRDFYQTFKDIVGNGWKIQNNPQVEEAMEFILKNRPSEAEEEWIKIAGGEDARFS